MSFGEKRDLHVSDFHQCDQLLHHAAAAGASGLRDNLCDDKDFSSKLLRVIDTFTDEDCQVGDMSTDVTQNLSLAENLT